VIKPKIYLLRLESVPIFEQLQIEEALLRSNKRNWVLVNHRSPPACVLGISGKINELLNQELLEKKPLPIIRRFSGGGTVVVDEETLFFTLICQHSDVNVPPFPKKILGWTEKLFAPLFKKQDFALRENDYVFGEKKFGGNAQYITKDRWLHHTSFLWDFSKERMQYLLQPQRQPAYRSNREHDDFLCCLKELFPSKEILINGLIEQVRNFFDIEEVPFSEVQPLLKRPHRKSTKLEELKKTVTAERGLPLDTINRKC